MQILVYGATGSQMRPLVDHLIERGHGPRILSRRARHPDVPNGATLVQGELEDVRSLARAGEGAEAIVFMLPAFLDHPSQALQYASNAATAAVLAGAKRIIWNTSGRYPFHHEVRDSDQLMIETHRRLEASNLPLTVIAPTTYMENLLGPWNLNAMVRGEVAYPVLANRLMGWIASRDVCALLAEAIERPHLAGSLFRVSGVEPLTGPQVAELFSEILGRNFKYRTLTPAEMKSAIEDAYGPGAGDEVATEYELDQTDPAPPLKHYDMAEVLRELPVRMTSFREWIRQNAERFPRGSL